MSVSFILMASCKMIKQHPYRYIPVQFLRSSFVWAVYTFFTTMSTRKRMSDDTDVV